MRPDENTTHKEKPFKLSIVSLILLTAAVNMLFVCCILDETAPRSTVHRATKNSPADKYSNWSF